MAQQSTSLQFIKHTTNDGVSGLSSSLPSTFPLKMAYKIYAYRFEIAVYSQPHSHKTVRWVLKFHTRKDMYAKDVYLFDVRWAIGAYCIAAYADRKTSNVM